MWGAGLCNALVLLSRGLSGVPRSAQSGEGSLGDPASLAAATASAALRGRSKGPSGVAAPDSLAPAPAGATSALFEQSTHLLHGERGGVEPLPLMCAFECLAGR